MRLVTLATCSLNQWAVDFEGNLRRVQESIRLAKEAGAVYRVGPELEITGYGCEDHFHEQDTCTHAWECVAAILDSDLTNGIVCDIGLPVLQGGVRYNCRVFCFNSRVLMIRPKMDLANDGNYREPRWFAGWKHARTTVDFVLPKLVADITGQHSVPFGDACLAFNDTTLASETCEELFTPAAPHIQLALNGVEIVANGSGSHHQLRKLDTRLDLMRSATAKAGGVYLYANQQGCDGGRLYYDGCAAVVVNGDVVAQGSQFSLADVELVTAVVDLDTVSSYRGAVSSMREQASAGSRIPTVPVDFFLASHSDGLDKFPSLPVPIRYHVPQEEIAMGPACWLWDYLRRSGASGFLLPLSGGADSSSVAAIVGCMCQLAFKAIEAGEEQVRADAARIGGYKDGERVASAHELASRVLHTVYMGTENSSAATRARAKTLAEQIGAAHLDVNIDSVISALIALFQTITGKRPKYKVDGGSNVENLALQNIQARLRMVVAFLLAQLLPWVRSKPGFLLVLASANVDEALRGYLTKYDCSAADINPIGGISKTDLRLFLKWGAVHLGYASLAEIEAAPPTAELEPIRANYTQTDEEDMGMSYAELSLYGRLRKIFQCGPVSMFQHLCHRWHGRLGPAEVAQKVKDFFKYYSVNRHKVTTLTPSYHAENYSPEDNRFDHRQFLYNTRWPWQFRRIDEMVAASSSSALPSSAVPEEGPTHAEVSGVQARPTGVPAAAAGTSAAGKGT
eukprot:jgi/Mesen1/3463/ME000194S02601